MHVHTWSQVRVLCSYPSDGGTMHITCSPPGVSNTCVPGCAGQCLWGEEGVSQMLAKQLDIARSGPEKRYNEVTYDTPPPKAEHFRLRSGPEKRYNEVTYDTTA